jgi:hypothetical protein
MRKSQRNGKRQVPAHFIYSVGVPQRTLKPQTKNPRKEPNFGETIPRGGEFVIRCPLCNNRGMLRAPDGACGG